jgi:hypothetical protein
MVDVVETPEVQTSLSHVMRTKPLRELWIPVLSPADENSTRFALRAENPTNAAVPS